MKPFLITVLLIIMSEAKSQQVVYPIQPASDSNSVIIHKDPRLDQLVKKQAQINEETTRNARTTGKGYRLLVINTNKRDDAIAAKTKVYTYFPEQKAYLIYQTPYFKVKVGNFKERKEAEDFQKKLSPYFPNGVFVINDIIEIKPEKFEDGWNDNPQHP